jgi:hypothetical protein
MTAAQMKKLDTIIGKIEALQHQVTERKDKEALEVAKKRLLERLWRD